MLRWIALDLMYSSSRDYITVIRMRTNDILIDMLNSIWYIDIDWYVGIVIFPMDKGSSWGFDPNLLGMKYKKQV